MYIITSTRNFQTVHVNYNSPRDSITLPGIAIKHRVMERSGSPRAYPLRGVSQSAWAASTITYVGRPEAVAYAVVDLLAAQPGSEIVATGWEHTARVTIADRPLSDAELDVFRSAAKIMSLEFGVTYQIVQNDDRFGLHGAFVQFEGAALLQVKAAANAFVRSTLSKFEELQRAG